MRIFLWSLVPSNLTCRHFNSHSGDICWTCVSVESHDTIYHLLTLIPCWDFGSSLKLMLVWQEDSKPPFYVQFIPLIPKGWLGSSPREYSQQFTVLVIIRWINISEITSYKPWEVLCVISELDQHRGSERRIFVLVQKKPFLKIASVFFKDLFHGAKRPRHFLTGTSSDNGIKGGQQTVESAFSDLKYLIFACEAQTRWLAGQFVMVSLDVPATPNALCHR